MSLVQFTTADGSIVMINPDLVESINPRVRGADDTDVTVISLVSGGYYHVKGKVGVVRWQLVNRMDKASDDVIKDWTIKLT